MYRGREIFCLHTQRDVDWRQACRGGKSRMSTCILTGQSRRRRRRRDHRVVTNIGKARTFPDTMRMHLCRLHATQGLVWFNENPRAADRGAKLRAEDRAREMAEYMQIVQKIRVLRKAAKKRSACCWASGGIPVEALACVSQTVVVPRVQHVCLSHLPENKHIGADFSPERQRLQDVDKLSAVQTPHHPKRKRRPQKRKGAEGLEPTTHEHT